MLADVTAAGPKFDSIDATGLSLNLGISIVFIGDGSLGTVQFTYFFINVLRAWYFGVELPCSLIGAS